MKKAFLFAALATIPTICLATPTLASVYIQYYNKDSQKYVMKAQMDGSTKEVTFDSSRTAAATIQGSGKVAIIETPCGKVEIKDNSKIEIKDGCIKVL
ncbi:hypothetical protein [Calothrix sp. 336/3]|uniref:hypothetical protein n=1 Tax=Calothrix sp. 336/3 TaxID=1337936 RepID=UPI0004E340AB|nr:hypothetical protein [Calothrix sp. 336/3]AKG20064.1 hypothetical protein IJ00_00950 [Calothrix sp. 336/3]